MALSIGVDVGGTKIAAGVVDEEGAVLERIQRASPANDRASILDTIVDCALELKESHPEAVAVGIGAAGFVKPFSWSIKLLLFFHLRLLTCYDTQ